MKYYDAHNHLQDERFAGRQDELISMMATCGVERMVVNGSCEDDWADVQHLATRHAAVLPSYGLHPWYHHQQTPQWRERLQRLLIENSRAAIGEIGLDRWKDDLPYTQQEEVFLDQWRMARELNRPASVHCLKAWGRMLELMQEYPGPAVGFVLHSYGGPAEMIDAFARLGAYFSFPGYYAHSRKVKQREVFCRVPMERLLIETDAPDQGLPDDLNRFPLLDPEDRSINHPANIVVVYEFVAQMRGMSLETLGEQVEQNFRRIFGLDG